MNILIDHGSSNNLGDASMVLSVVLNLRERFPGATLHVVHRSSFIYGSEWGDAAEFAPRFRVALPFFVRDAPLPARVRRRLDEGVRRYVLRQSDATERTSFRNLRSGEAGDLSLIQPPGQTLREFVERYDALHVVGGGNLTETFPWHLLHRTSLIYAFQEQGKPIVLTGQQIGPFPTDKYWPITAEALRRATFVGLREPTDSVALVRRAGVPEERFAMMGDDAFGLDPADSTEVDERLARRGLSTGQFFTVNLRIGDHYAGGHADHLDTVAGMIDRLADAYGMPALVVPIALNEDDSDLAAGKRLRSRVQTVDLHLLDDSDLTPSVVKGVMERAVGAVGVSYHFCTFALSQGVPAVCIYDGAYYGQKARGLAALWKHDGIALGLEGMDPSRAADHVQSIWDDGALRDQLRERSDQAIDLWHETFTRATAVYASAPPASALPVS